MKTYFYLIMKWMGIVGLVSVGLWLRFWHLDAVPAALYHDEMDYVVTGESLLKWGTDLSGTWTPWQLRPLQTINFTAEWPALFHAVTQFVLGSVPAAARLTNALWGLATVVLLGFLATKLSGKVAVGWWTSALMLVNHWHIHVSRLGYESTISLFFQILLLYGLTQILPIPQTKEGPRSKSKALLWVVITIVALITGYFTYHGAKFTIIVITFSYGCWWLIRSLKFREQNVILRRSWVMVGILSTVLIALIIHSLWTNQQGLFGSRSKSDLYSIESTSTLVDRMRRDQVPVGFSLSATNKYVVAANELIKRYSFVFDTNRLFITGYEGTYQFSLLVSGYFGLLELLGLLMFFFFADRKSPYQKLLVFLLIVSPIATVIAGYQALLRSAFTYALLIMFAGWGIALIAEKRKWFNVGILAWMVALGIWFGLEYFSRYPLLTAENHMLSERILARYVRQTKLPITIVVDKDSYITARAIAYYNQMIPRLSVDERRQFAFPFPATFTMENVTITTQCPTVLSNSLLVINPSKWKTCGLADMRQLLSSESPLTALPSPLDNGSTYLIWHNYLCGDTGRDFIHLSQLSDISVETMSDAQFCQTWVKNER